MSSDTTIFLIFSHPSAGCQGIVGPYGVAANEGAEAEKGAHQEALAALAVTHAAAAHALRVLRGVPCDTGRLTPLPCDAAAAGAAGMQFVLSNSKEF